MQSSSLSTYIGYITGPRAEQPVGVRVVEPTPGSRQFQRGSLYAVVEVVGDHPDRGAIVDRLLSEVQRVYYSAKGSQSQVMVEAVQQTQHLLREINAHTPHYPMQLGITCAALLGSKLLVASSGPAFALMRVSDRVHMFPSEPNMSVTAMAGSNAAGGYGNVPIEVYRQDVQVDDAMFLGGGGWLRRVPTRTLASIVAFTNVDNCADAADELYDQAGQMQVPGLLIVLGSGGNNEPPRPSGYGGGGYGGGYTGGPGSAPAGGGARPPQSRRPRFGALPTSVNTAPPARLPPPQVPPSQSAPGQFSPGASLAPVQEPLPPAKTAQVPDSLAEREQPPPESAALRTEPPPPADAALEAPPLAVDEPIAETPLRPTQNSELLENEIATHTVDEAETRRDATLPTKAPPLHEASGRAPTRPYPVSPLEESSFGGDLPVEPDEDFDPIFPPSTVQSAAEAPPRPPNWLEQWQAGASVRMAQARGFFGRMLPDRRRPDEESEWEEISDELIAQPKPARPRYNELAAEQVRADISETRHASTVGKAGYDEADDVEVDADRLDASAPVLEMSPFAPPAPTRGVRARVFLLIALLTAVVVVVVVVALTLGPGNANRVEAEQLTARAELVLMGAQSALDQGDKVTARERLTEAEDYLAQAIALDGMNDVRAQLIATIESELQEVLQVTPLYGLTTPLITFPPDARPQKVLVMNDDIFIIDGGRQALLQYRYDAATGIVSDQTGQVLLTQGQQVGNVTVGPLTDMAWLPLIPAVEDRPILLVTDRNNNIFRYDQRVEGATLMQMGDRATWGSIGQVQTYLNRVYIADETRGLILRYSPGQFDAPGEPWFSSETQVNLAGLLSMEIDGDIWLLFNNGAILRYRERQQLPFSPEISTALADEPTDMVVTRQSSNYLYVVDAGSDRILVYDKEGAYIAQLEAPEDDLLRGLSGLYIDETGRTMYILTQTGLFSHPVLP